MKEESEKVALKLNIQKMKIMVPSLHGKEMGKEWKQCQTLFFWAPKSLQIVICSHEIKTLTPWKESYDQPRHYIENQRELMLLNCDVGEDT